MDSESQTTNQTEFYGAIILPSGIGIIYAIYLFIAGSSYKDHSIPPILIAGGLISVITFPKHIYVILNRPEKSLSNAFWSATVFVPFIYSLYLMFYLGIYGAAVAVWHHEGVRSLLLATLMTIAGWRMLYMIERCNARYIPRRTIAKR